VQLRRNPKYLMIYGLYLLSVSALLILSLTATNFTHREVNLVSTVLFLAMCAGVVFDYLLAREEKKAKIQIEAEH